MKRLQLSSKLFRTWLESACFMALIPHRTNYPWHPLSILKATSFRHLHVWEDHCLLAHLKDSLLGLEL